MQFFLEVSFVYGRAQLQVFYGPFATSQERDAYVNTLHEREHECIQEYSEAEAMGDISSDDAAGLKNLVNPNHAKYIHYDGPIPSGFTSHSALEIAGEIFSVDEGVSCWYKEEDMNSFLESYLRQMGLGGPDHPS